MATTHLKAAMGPTDLTITAPTAGFSSSGTVQIDSEQLTYSSTTSTAFAGVQRGANGSTPAAHATAATVRQIAAVVMTGDEARIIHAAEGTLEDVFSGGAQGNVGGTAVQVLPIGQYFLVPATQKPALRDTFRGALLAVLRQLFPPSYPDATPLLNSWSNAANFNTAGYFKDGFGIVHLKGVVQGGQLGTSVFQLPTGHRPSAPCLFGTVARASASQHGFACVQVDSDGAVRAVSGTGAISLDGLSFRATQ
jgi:hypothetical protein